MNSSMFQRFIGIDWSGAKDCSNGSIQVAEFSLGSSHPKLVQPLGNSHWTRQAVFKYLDALDDQPTIVGFDFAFSVPWPAATGPLPSPDAAMETAANVWERVDNICGNELNDFFAGPVWLSDDSPFRPFIYHYPSGHKGHAYKRDRLRTTEKIASRRPISVYHMAGAQVGQGSFAGMRFLHALRRGGRRDIAVWPFDETARARSIIVEVYPRLFWHLAGRRRPRRKDSEEIFYEKLRVTLLNFGVETNERICGPSRDAADAVVTAAALCAIGVRDDAFRIPHPHQGEAIREGWIFGVGG